MTKLSFAKYEGTGNDFILVDNRTGIFDAGRHDRVSALCDRRRGIGADGLMLLQETEGADFEMRYFNADGLPGSLCGNGGRCITLFAKRLGLVQEQATFLAADGLHRSRILGYDSAGSAGYVSLQMNDVGPFETASGRAVLDTGSPHLVLFVDDTNAIDVVAEGRQIRFGDVWREKGINVNFVSKQDGALSIRTYERGVEDETLSCGTGAVAAALAASMHGWMDGGVCRLMTRGGDLTVRFTPAGKGFRDIHLEGPARHVFDGKTTF